MIIQIPGWKLLKNKHTNAFSFIEVLISLLIISMLTLLLYFSFGTIIKSYNLSKKKIKNSITQINTDSILRSNIEKICIPFWENEYDFSFSKNSLTINWLNGINETKTIIIPDIVCIIDVDMISNTKGKAIGLRILYQIEDSDYELTASFASIPYGVKKF